MGLQVWLPLNKDTRNNGLTNVTVTNNGATLSNNGVFDKCYSFNGSNSYLTFSSPVSLNSDNSICCWLDLTNMSNTQYFVSFTGGGGIRYSGGDNQFLYYMGGAIVQWTYTKVNKFVHVAFVRKSNTLSLYVNGTLIGDKSLTTSANCDGIGKRSDGYYYSGKMNDFRIYDHCITEEDVKRIYNCKIMDICASSYNGGFFYDNSGLLINDLVSTGLTFSGNSMYFNGTTTQIRPKDGTSGLNISGGTLSIWFTPLSAPTTYKIVYMDKHSGMALGFLSSSKFVVTNNSKKNAPPFDCSNIQYGSINNVIISYDSAYTPTYCYINGVKSTQRGSNDGWTDNGPLTIGGCLYQAPNRHFNGYISKVTVYRNQLTEDEAKQLYAIGLQNKILPDEYTRLEYIEATGTQYIKTNVRQFNTDKIIIEFDYTPTSLGGWFGGNAYTQLQITGSTGFIADQNSKVKIEYKDKKEKVYNNGVLKVNISWGTTTSYDNIPIEFFALGYSPTSSANNSNGKLYNAVIYQNDVLMCKLCPAKRKSDNVIGMYDIVTHTFFTNAGTGTFTAGPEI